MLNLYGVFERWRKMSGKMPIIPAELKKFLDGNNISVKQHEAMLLQTVSENGWSHTAMISVGEIVMVDNELRIALWPETNTTNNILRTNKASLVIVYQHKVYYIQLLLKVLPDIPSKYKRTRFAAQIISLREDSAKYADITSGVTFKLYNPAEVLERWEVVLNELKM